MESSQNWNIEIVPGAKRVRRAVDFVKNIAMLGTQTELCLSGHIVRREHVVVDEGLVPFEQLSFDEQGMLDFERVFGQ